MKNIKPALLIIAALISAFGLSACDVNAVLGQVSETASVEETASAEDSETTKAEEIVTTEAAETETETEPAEETLPNEAETTAAEQEAETAEDKAAAERAAFEEKVAAAMKPVAYVNEDTIGEIFSTATEIWKWFNMSTIPTSGEPVNGTFQYKVDYPYINTYADLEKYVRNYFSTEIADKLLSYRSDYTDIDGHLCVIPADRVANINYGKILSAELSERSASFVEYTLEVQKYSFAEDTGDLIDDGSETFIFKLQMDKYGCWRFVSFPMWM
jgi:hypothetical protein